MLALAMWPLLRGFARFETPPATGPYTGGTVRVLVAAALVGLGLLTLTVAGFVPGTAPCSGRARSWRAWRSPAPVPPPPPRRACPSRGAGERSGGLRVPSIP